MPARKVSSVSVKSEKPSLADLKSVKVGGVAARKKAVAVKKIEAGMSRKVSTIKITKKAGEKKVVIKRTSGKSSKKDLFAVPSSSSGKSPVTNDPILRLPTNISIRAREKALVLLEAVSKDFDKSARHISYVSGLCLILLGASMSLAFSTPFGGDQSAQLLSSTTDNLTNTAVQTTNTVVAELPKITAQVEPQIPAEVRGKTTHRISVSNARKVQIFAEGSNTGKQSIQVSRIEGDRFEFTLDAEQLKPDRYVLALVAESSIDGRIKVFNLPTFVVPIPPGAQPDTTSSSGSDMTADTSETPNSDESLTNDTVAAQTEPDTEETQTEEVKTQEIPKILLVQPKEPITGKYVFKIFATSTLPKIEILSRKKDAQVTPTPMGFAYFASTDWRFSFDSKNLPNGEYEFFARSAYNGNQLKSSNVTVRIANILQTAVPPTASSLQPAVTNNLPSSEPIATEPIKSTVENEPLATPETNQAPAVGTTPLRTFSEFKVEDVSSFSSSSVEIERGLTKEVDTVFVNHQDALRDLLKRYALAQQSGDKIMLELAEKELREGKQKIVNDVLTNQSLSYLADDINEDLDVRFDDLKKRINTFEELRKTASNNESAVDKDGDGITDYDESFLFGTNPENPDSDNDGVIDGIEIMRGFDPVDPSTEAIIEYEMPQESLALVEEELLKVDTVAPVIRADVDEATPPVQAEIRGKGLPNSFVTLYIFSTPTIVTVKTDQDGSFVYTFEKELEDGEHEVYVAMTDNTGSIVAQSSPFRFVKEAQAFTPVDDNGEALAIDTSSSAVNSFSLYNVIVGLGLLALGLILLMLGVGLREREKMTNPVPSNDLQPST